MNRTTAFIIGTLALGLSACNSTSMIKPISDKSAAEYVPASNPTQGIVVASFTVQGNSPNKMAMVGVKNFELSAYNTRFHPATAEGKENRFYGTLKFDAKSVFGGKANSDYAVEEGRGHVLVIPLEAGNYEFFSWDMVHNTGSMSVSWDADQDFAIPFSVRPGEATYIGEIKVSHAFRKSLLGQQIPAGGTFSCMSQFERDEPLLKMDYPLLGSVKFKQELICSALEGVQ